MENIINRKKGKLSIGAIALIICGALFAIIIPRVTKDYSMMIINLSLIFAINTYGLQVMLGMGGQLTFAQVAFMGVGTYITANLTSGRLGFYMNTSLALLVSVLGAAVVAFVFGLILFRLQGTFFTFATIGLVQVAWVFYRNYKPLFGGPDGISGIQTLKIFGFRPANYVQWFYILFIFVIIVALLVEQVKRTRLGRSLAAVRDNEIAAKTLGVNVYMTKVIAFTIAGTLAGLAGSLYAMHSQFVSSDLFTFERATSYIIMAMLGGVNSTVGIFVGSILVTMLPEWLRSVESYLQLFYGIGVILLMVFMPMGLAGLGRSIADKVKRKFTSRKNNHTAINKKGETS